jgi:hypothetical protein
LLLSIIAAAAYYFLQDSALGGIWVAAIKASAVGSLAIYALRRGQGPSAKLLALALGIAAFADAAIQFSLEIGGLAFFAAHVAAIVLYLRYPRQQTSPSQKMLAVTLLIGTPLIAWLVSGSWHVGVYAVSLGGMAACAWMSRFTRYRVGLGAVLFVISDWLLFSRYGPWELGGYPEMGVWPIYYLGQFLIATGVVQTLRHELPEEGG